MASWCFVGEDDHPVVLLRHPKCVSIGVGEIHTRGRGLALDALLTCLLPTVFSTRGLSVVLTVLRCGASSATLALSEGATAWEAAVAALSDIYAVAADDVDTPASCGIVPASSEVFLVRDEDCAVPGVNVPVRGEGTPAPVDDAPAVVDDVSSSRRFHACWCSLSLLFSCWCTISVTLSSSGVLSCICAHWRFIPGTVALSGVLLPRLVVYMFLPARVCPSHSDTLFCSGVVGVVLIVPPRAR